VHDPGHLLFRRALRVAIVLPLAYLFTQYVLQMPAGSTYTVFGTFVLLSFADFGGPTRDRALAYIFTGIAGLVAVVLGTVAALNPFAAVICTFIVGAGLTYTGLLRGYVATATMSILLPFVIAVTAGPGLDQLPQRLIGFAVAVVVSLAAALLMWPAHYRSALRQRIADTMDASANVIRAMWPAPTSGSAPVIDLHTRQRELTEAHHRMREQYDGQMMRPGSATSRDRALLQTIDELGRLRIILRWEPRTGDYTMPGDQALADCAAEAMDRSGDAIGRGGPAPQSKALDHLREQHRVELENWSAQQLSSGNSQVVRPTIDAGFHLRLTAAMAELVARHTRIAVGAPPEEHPFTGWGLPSVDHELQPWRILRNHLTFRSPWFRNSLRAGLALALAVTVVYATGVGHGFWVVLGTLTALRLDVLGTGKTAVQAIVGTIGGFLVGTGVILLFGDKPLALWILLPVVIFMSGYAPGAISLAVGQGSFTVFVIVFYGIVAGPSLETGEWRVVDVGIGLAISLVVSLMMWPRGVAGRVNESLIASVHASTAYLVAAYERLANGPAAQEQLELAATAADAAVGNAYESFDLAIAQRGNSESLGPTWSFVANAAGHIAACADLVVFLSTVSTTPSTNSDAGKLLVACAKLVQSSADTATDRLCPTLTDKQTQDYCNQQAFTPEQFDQPEVSGLGHAFAELESQVDTCLADWQDTATSPANDSVGQQALSLVWAEEWLIHLMWVTSRIEAATSAKPGSAPLTPIESDKTEA
jgi:uncharacterized membrane protein YccC